MPHNSYADLLLAKNALAFGDYTTKSGRSSPYFVNTGSLCDGESLAASAQLYSNKILEECDLKNSAAVLFGPAYKGIPLVVSVCQELSTRHNINTEYCFNRKEAKAHGESGSFVGRVPKQGEQVIILEDVLTAGTSLRETYQTLKPLGCRVSAIVVGLDRQEIGEEVSAIQEIEELFGCRVYSLATIAELLDKSGQN